MTKLGLNQRSVLVLYDSSNAIHLCKNTAYLEKTKNIDIKLHFIRNEVSNSVIKMIKIHTDENHSDALTKVVHVGKFRTCLDIVGLCSFWDIWRIRDESDWGGSLIQGGLLWRRLVNQIWVLEMTSFGLGIAFKSHMLVMCL